MKIYKGNLIGGPDNGNSVESTVPRIQTETSSELWLDGRDKDSTIVVERGSYYWNDTFEDFYWRPEDVAFYSKRMLEAA